MQHYTGLLFRIFFVLPLLGTVTGISQDWSWALALGGPGDESCRELAVASDGTLISGGSFNGAFSPAGDLLPDFGGEDVFLAATGTGGAEAAWAISMGSTLDDQLDALIIAPDGDLLVAGSYWLEGFFGDTTIQTSLHPRAIFLARFDPAGQLLWVRSIEGSGLKQVNDLAVDAPGGLYLAGYFSELLAIDDDTLTAAGTSDLFLLKLTAGGNLIWSVQEGLKGDTRAVALAVEAGGQVVISGYFNDTTRIAGEVFTANTADRDVFLARYDEQGSGLWARKAGGVLEDDVSKLAIDANGDIYAAGFLIGVMTLDENLSIQSSTGWSDFYLLRYSADGTPLAARAMGGTRLQEASDLVIAGGKFLISGFYQGEMTIDGITIIADDFAFSGFVVALDHNLGAVWLKDIPGTPSAFATSMARSPGDEVWVGGTFRGTLQLGQDFLQAQGGFDIFLAQLAPELTPVAVAPSAELPVQLFPNPVTDMLWVRFPYAASFTIELFAASGKLCGFYNNPSQISVRHLPAGSYWLRWRTARQSGWQQIIVQ